MRSAHHIPNDSSIDLGSLVSLSFLLFYMPHNR